MSKITQYVRHLAVVAIATLLAQVGWAEVTVTPKLLINFAFNATPEVTGWHRHYQNGGGKLGGDGITENGITFSTTSGGNFYERAKVSGDYQTGTYVGIDGATEYTSITDEIAGSLNFGESIAFTDDVWKTGLMNGGVNGHTATISGLSTSNKYVVYLGYGLYKSDGPNQQSGFEYISNGYSSVDSIQYVKNTDTSYQNYTSGQIYPAGSGLMVVRLNGVVPTANGELKFKLVGDRAGMNFIAVGLIEGTGPIEVAVAEVGTTRYSSLADAIAAAQAGEIKVVSLLANIESDVEIPEGITIAATPDTRVTGAISGAGMYSIALAAANNSAVINTLFTANQLTGFSGTILMTKGRFEFGTDQVSLIPSAVTLATSNQGKIYLGSGEWNNHFVIAGNGWTGDGGYKMGPVALRVDGATFGESASIQAVVESDVVPAIGVYNTNPTLCAITGNGGLRLRADQTQTITISAANLSGLSGAITLVDANATLAISVEEGSATVANNISGDGKLKKVGAGTLTCTGSNTFTGGLVIDAGTVEGTFSAPITGAGTYALALANANTSASIGTKFTEGQLDGFTGTVLMTKGRFTFDTAQVSLIPSAVTLATSNQGKIYLGSGTWNNSFVIAGNGWTGDGSYKMGPVALRVDNATFGENASIQAVVENNVVPAIGIYNTNPTLCAITGNGGLRLRSHNAQTITIPAANLSGLSGAINLVDANAMLEITAAEAATVANDISGSGKIKKSGEGALTLSGAVSCAVKLAAGTIVSETVTGSVTTDVAGKHVAFDEATNTYSLEIDNVSIAIPTVEHMDVAVTVGGEAATITDGAITIAPGTTFTVTYTPQAGYCGSATSTDYTAGAQVTVTAPEAPAAAVAQAAGVNYATIEEALANVGSTLFVTLLTDLTVAKPIEVPTGIYAALNFGGHTITRTVMGSYVFKVPAGAYLEFGNGNIVNTASEYPYAIENKGTIRLLNVNVTGMVTTFNGGWTFVEKSFKATAPVTFYMDWNSIASVPYLAVEESVGDDKVTVSYREFQGTGSEVYHAIASKTENFSFEGELTKYTIYSVSDYAKAALVTKSETNATIEILSGTYELNNATTADQGDTVTFTVTPAENYVLSSVTVNGEVVSPDAEGVYSITVGEAVAIAAVAAVPEKPAASVADLTEGVPADLQSAYVFTADTASAEQAGYYDLFNANLEVSFSKAVAKDSILLKGSYSAWESGAWIEMPMTKDLAANEVWTLLPVDQVQYRDVLAIGEFKCGVANLDAANNGTVMTVKLVLSKDGETLPALVTKTYTLVAPKVTRPSEVEGGSTDQKSAYDKWAKEAGSLSGLTNTQIIDRFIFNVDADTPDEDLEEALDEVIEKTDCFAKLMDEIAKGNDPTAYTFTLEVYPNATFKFVPVPAEEITTSAKLFRLTATFVPANDK